MARIPAVQQFSRSLLILIRSAERCSSVGLRSDQRQSRGRNPAEDSKVGPGRGRKSGEEAGSRIGRREEPG